MLPSWPSKGAAAPAPSLLLAVLLLCHLCARPVAATVRLTIPAGGPPVPVQRIFFNCADDTLDLDLFNSTAQVIDPRTHNYGVRWNAPLWIGSYKGHAAPLALHGPAIVLGTSTFRISLKNRLPYQPACTCGCDPDGTNPNYCIDCVTATTVPDPANPLNIFNGPHNLLYTNMHTHGLKVDVGANDINNLDVCAPLVGGREGGRLCNTSPGAPGSTNVNADISCNVFSDNVFVDVLPGGMRATNTYILPHHVPGTLWYHDHEHGSVAYLTPTTHGVILVPDIKPQQLFAPKCAPIYKDMMGVTDWKDWTGGDKDTWTQWKSWKSRTQGWGNEGAKAGRWGTYNQRQWTSSGCDQPSIDKCNKFIEIIGRLPNFAKESEILVFQGLWFRTNENGPPEQPQQPDDDTLPNIACRGLPPDLLMCSKGLGPSSVPGSPIFRTENIDNRAKVDWVAVNSVIQPTLTLTAGKYKRWLMVGALTMKFLDLTIRHLPQGDETQARTPVTTCKIWLLSHDGVYLEHIPRYPLTTRVNNQDLQTPVNNLVLGPGNRIDVLVKCTQPGTYGLFSGAGPLSTSDLCTATHCECFGSRVALPNVTRGDTTGNSFYQGKELNSALIALIEVKGCQTKRGSGNGEGPNRSLLTEADNVNNNDNDKNNNNKDKNSGHVYNSCEPEPDLEENACRTRLELFEYTDIRRTLQLPEQQTQCVNLVNTMGGGFCNVNGKLFGDGVICITQGSGQRWHYRGHSFHPFHLHETPVQLQETPACLARNGVATNFWSAKDWFDTVYVPPCQCNTTADTMCDNVPTAFRGTAFPPVPSDFATSNKQRLEEISHVYLHEYKALQMDSFANLNAQCQDRYSVLHCHVLSHEDEGCMSLVWWKCPSTKQPNGAPAGICSVDAVCPAQGALATAMAAITPSVLLERGHGHMQG